MIAFTSFKWSPLLVNEDQTGHQGGLAQIFEHDAKILATLLPCIPHGGGGEIILQYLQVCGLLLMLNTTIRPKFAKLSSVV